MVEPIAFLHSSFHHEPRSTLKEETFAGRNFRGSGKPQNIYISQE